MAAPDLPSAHGLRLVLVTAPPHRAQDLARSLVETGPAACVNVVPGLRSLFHWQGEVQDEPESLLLIKVAEDHLEALAAQVQAEHPYEVPEFLVLSPERSLAPWLAWALGTDGPSAEGPPIGGAETPPTAV